MDSRTNYSWSLHKQESKPAQPSKPVGAPVVAPVTNTITTKPVAPTPTATAVVKQPVSEISEDSQLDSSKRMLRIKRNRRVIRTGPVSSMGLPELRIPGYGYTAPIVPYNGSPTQAHTGTFISLPLSLFFDLSSVYYQLCHLPILSHV
jgi:hypothetical protein